MDNKNLGRNINGALARKDMKQKELAEALGVTANVISYYCSGARTPPLKQLAQIAKILDTTTDYLLGLTDDPAPQKSVIDDLGITAEVASKLSQHLANDDFYNPNREKLNSLLERDDIWLLLSKIADFATNAKAEEIFNEILAKHDNIFTMYQYEIHDELLQRAEEYAETDSDLRSSLIAKAHLCSLDEDDSLFRLGLSNYKLTEITSFRVTEVLNGILRNICNGVDETKGLPE